MSSTKPLLVYILCYAGKFGTPGSVLWRVHSANEVTLTVTELIVAHRASSGATSILSQLLVESVPLNTVKLPTR